MSESRLRYVRMFLVAETDDQRIVIRWVSPRAWANEPSRRLAREHHPLGFSAPVQVGDESVVTVCAEVLVAACASLNDADFFGVIDSVRTHLHLHVIEMARVAAPDLIEVGVMQEQPRYTDLDFPTFMNTWVAATRAARETP